jgi:hypothetical protein
MVARWTLVGMHPWVLALPAGLPVSSAPVAIAQPEVSARADTSAAGPAERATLTTRIQSQTPDPRGEAALRDLIAGITRGNPNYSVMSEDLARQVTQHLTPLQSAFVSLGRVLVIRFLGVDAQGMDIYQVRQLRGQSKIAIRIAPDGQIESLHLRGELFSTPTMPIAPGRAAGGEPMPTD